MPSLQPAERDRGSTRATRAKTPAAAAAHGVELAVVKLAETEPGFVLPPRRWVVERSFARAARFRRSARDYKRPPSALAKLRFLAFMRVMVQKAAPLLASGPCTP